MLHSNSRWRNTNCALASITEMPHGKWASHFNTFSHNKPWPWINLIFHVVLFPLKMLSSQQSQLKKEHYPWDVLATGKHWNPSIHMSCKCQLYLDWNHHCAWVERIESVRRGDGCDCILSECHVSVICIVNPDCSAVKLMCHGSQADNALGFAFQLILIDASCWESITLIDSSLSLVHTTDHNTPFKLHHGKLID